MRELFWQGQEVYIEKVFQPIIVGVLVFSPIIIALLALSLFRRYRLWRLGGTDHRFDHPGARLVTTLGVALAHVRTLREAYPGVMHLLIFWGTVLLILGKVVRLFSYPVGLTSPPQSVFLYASLTSEIGGVLVLVGGGIAIYRRYVVRPPRLDTRPDDTLIFGWAFLLILTGFMVKGYRIAASDMGSPTDWAMWSPVGYLLSHVFPTFDTPARNEILVWHRALIHTIPAFLFLSYIWMGRSRLQHVVLSPLNVFFRSLRVKGALVPIDFDTAETFGVARIEEFTWKHLMDLDACTRCGRCQDNCPAYLSGKALSPKKVILDLKAHLYEVYPVPLITKPVEHRRDMITEVITEEAVWDCTTCRACMQACPVYIEHIDKIVEMRRNLALERAQFPELAEQALRSLGARGHPWRGATAGRTDWAAGLNLRVLSESSDVDVLYWVGCTAALDERNMRVSANTAKIMQAAGVRFGILGPEEVCCGEPARKMGDEHLFQTLCRQNIELFQRYGVKKIVASCPHCFNTLKNEYPQFGGSFEVVHHSQLIADLIRQGKLDLGGLNGMRAAYHDSCYLGRHNDVFDDPRSILDSVGGIERVELARSRLRSFCCGGGGGHMWMEEPPETRINLRRVEDILKARVDVVATACPFCLLMLEDGLRTREADGAIRAMDLSELVGEALARRKGA